MSLLLLLDDGLPFPRSLFSAGEQGIWLDPSDFSTLYQDAAGTTPVTAVGQPVGLALDKSGRGNHATQSTSASRPTVEARVNLLTKSEFPGGVADSGTRGGLITGVSLPSWLDRFTTGIAFGHDGATVSYIYLGPAPASTQVTFSVYVKMDDGLPPSFGSPTTTSALNDFAIPVSSSVPSPLTYKVENQGGGVYRVSVVQHTTGTNNLSNNGMVKYPSNSSRTFQVTGYQLEYGPVATTYQRVNTATDYVDVGAPRYLSFDGTDDGMETPSINFTGTDKMTVWAGVRKLSDAAAGIICELSADRTANNGAFSLVSSGAPSFLFASKGTLDSTNTVTGNASPISRVLTGIGDIAGDKADLRVNGSATPATTDQGTGTYGNYPLYIGRRNNASLPFNGRIYQLIVRGAASNAGQIAAGEAWCNSKTRAY